MPYLSLDQINSNPIFAPCDENMKEDFCKRLKDEMEKQFGFLDDHTVSSFDKYVNHDLLKYFYHDDPDIDWKGYALDITGYRFSYRVIKTNKNKCEVIRICNIDNNKRKYYKNYTKSRIVEDMRFYRSGFYDGKKNWDSKHESNKEDDKDRIWYAVRAENLK